MLCTVACCWWACGGDRFSALVSITKPCKVMKHKQPYAPGSYMSSVFVRIYKRFLPRPSASIAVFLLLAMVFQPLAVVLAYEESGQVQAVDASVSTNVNLDSRSESGMTTIDPVRGSTSNIDVVEASPSIVLDNIAGVREEVFGDSLTETDVVLDPVTDTAEPEATGTDNTDIPGDGEEVAVEDDADPGAAGLVVDPLAPEDPIQSFVDKRNIDPKVDQQTGALVYEIPINTPAGVSGATPNIALKYNSQVSENDSIVGLGWDITIPYIERLNKKGVDKMYLGGENDYFTSSLSGELKNISGTSWGPRSEDGSFMNYTYSANVWTVKDKEGNIYTFGADTSSRQDNPTDISKIYKWMLSSVTDTHGNTVTYSYFKNEGQIYPNQITYAGVYKIDFIREAQTYPLTVYHPAFKVKTNYRISEISIKVSDTEKRRYEIDYIYTTENNRSLLASVNEVGVNDEGIETIIDHSDFDYTTNGPLEDADGDLWLIDESWIGDTKVSSNQSYYVRFADINGDALVDFLCDSSTGNEPCYDIPDGEGYSNKVDLNTGRSFESSSVNTAHPHYYEYPGDDDGDGGTRYIDVDGDGVSESLYGIGVGGSDELLNDIAEYNSETESWVHDLPYTNIPQFVDDERTVGIKVGDINADGLPDVVCYTENERCWHHELNDGYGRITYKHNGTGWDICLYASCAMLAPMQFYGEEDDTDMPTGAELIDINNDGLSDIVQGFDADDYSYPRKAYVNNGVDWAYDITWTGIPYLAEDGTTRYPFSYFGDVNGDGLTDVICGVEEHEVCYDPVDLDKDNYGIYINKGDRFEYNQTYFLGQIDWLDDDNPDLYEGGQFVDIDGDTLVDYYFLDSATELGGLPDIDGPKLIKNQFSKSQLLSSVTNSLGGSTTFIHKPSTQYRTVEDKLANPSLPVVVYTVEKIESDDGFGNLTTKGYFYEDGHYYYNGPFDRKFAGFGVVSEIDSDGNVTKNYYHQGNETNTALGEYDDNFAKIGQVYRTEKYDDAGNLYETTINKWDSVNLGTDRDFVKLARSASLTYDSDADHKDRVVEYTYDDATGNKLTEKNWGEVSADEVTGEILSDIGTDTRNSTYTYAEDVTGIMQFPSQVTIADNAGAKLREEKYFYDNQPFGIATKGDMTKKNTWKIGATYVSETYTYNTYGNVTKYKDPLSNQTTYTYDAYNLLPTKVTNPLSHTVQYTYDYSSGKPLTIKNPNGFTSTYIYDGLDRVIEEKVPNPTTGASVTKTTYVYDDVSFPRSVHKSVICDATIAKEVYTYVDGFGRVIQTRNELETPDMYSVTDTIYDERGNISATSLPYEVTGTEFEEATEDGDLLTYFSYDPMNRVVSIENILGTTTYEYDDWKKTVTDANEHVKVFYENAYGNLVQVTEKNGFFSYNTYYTWNTIGELTKITDALGNVRNFTYNGFGKRLTAEDLHASADVTFGVWTYTYDNAGNMTKTVSPKAETVNYTYDVLNRVLSENWTGGAGVEVVYTYDTCTNGKGKLCSAVRGGVTTTYTYTPTEQVKDESTTIDGTVYTTTTSYNYCGNPIEITHPNGTKTRYLYDSVGAVNGIQRKETTGGYQNIVSNVDYTEFGKPVSVSFANGVVTTYTYGDLQRLSDIDTVKDANVIQDLHYDYDPVGNIIAITDASGTATTKTAMYTYDSLDRLTLAEVYGTPTGEDYVESFAYNAIGNLTTKGDSGTYLYQGNTGTNYANPHAATKVGVVTFTYDNNGNLTNDGTNTYSWNYRNEQTSATTPTGATSYVYNHDGARMKYVAPGQTVITPASTYEVEGATQRRHVYLGDMLVGTVETGVATPGTRYAHTDHLGSVEKMTDSTGAILETNDYFPYGEIRVKEGDTGGDRSYLGKYHDDATGLEYLEARYYSSARGQFVSQDPAFWSLAHADKQLVDPQSWNSYSYARNNPLLMKDPEGEFAIEAMLLMTFGRDIIRGVLERQQKTESTQNETPSLPTPESAAPANANSSEVIADGLDGWIQQQPRECFQACKTIAGYKSTEGQNMPGKNLPTLTTSDGGATTQVAPNAQEAINAIDSYINSGQRIIVGIENASGYNNNDMITDHYVVIVGSGMQDGQKYYRFFDPGRGTEELGTSKENKLYLQSSGSISGYKAGGGTKFTVSQVRLK